MTKRIDVENINNIPPKKKLVSNTMIVGYVIILLLAYGTIDFKYNNFSVFGFVILLVIESVYLLFSFKNYKSINSYLKLIEKSNLKLIKLNITKDNTEIIKKVEKINDNIKYNIYFSKEYDLVEIKNKNSLNSREEQEFIYEKLIKNKDNETSLICVEDKEKDVVVGVKFKDDFSYDMNYNNDDFNIDFKSAKAATMFYIFITLIMPIIDIFAKGRVDNIWANIVMNVPILLSYLILLQTNEKHLMTKRILKKKIEELNEVKIKEEKNAVFNEIEDTFIISKEEKFDKIGGKERLAKEIEEIIFLKKNVERKININGENLLITESKNKDDKDMSWLYPFLKYFAVIILITGVSYISIIMNFQKDLFKISCMIFIATVVIYLGIQLRILLVNIMWLYSDYKLINVDVKEFKGILSNEKVESIELTERNVPRFIEHVIYFYFEKFNLFSKTFSSYKNPDAMFEYITKLREKEINSVDLVCYKLGFNNIAKAILLNKEEVIILSPFDQWLDVKKIDFNVVFIATILLIVSWLLTGLDMDANEDLVSLTVIAVYFYYNIKKFSSGWISKLYSEQLKKKIKESLK